MRASRLLSPTLREVPAEAEVASHQLMLRAGMMRKVAAGVYTYLPLGYRVIRKIEGIVREEMDRAGGQEILMPIMQPAELWQQSGRWEVYGEEMFRLQDRHQRDFCLGPTHEEVVTDLAAQEVSSHRQFPLLLYQIQNKYRDERRPRFGLMRGREFIMKDMYSFDQDEEGMHETYRQVYEAYQRVFRRCGLQARAVEADTGAIGGHTSHEFMVLAEAGEAEVVYCQQCDYAANVEKAPALPAPAETEQARQREEVHTPGARSINEVAALLDTAPQRLVKTLVYQADGRLVAVLLRGDREINEVKLARLLDARELHLADPELVARETGAPAGFLGPLGLDLPVYSDREVPLLTNAITGANREDYHLLNVQPGRDFALGTVADLRQAQAGDACPQCGGTLAAARGIEVGQVFQLGTKYSAALGAVFSDREGQVRTAVMGCYGIGVSRTMAASIEQHHDERGIIWPAAIAPYQVVVVPAGWNDPAQREAAEGLYRRLLDAGLEVLLDDRDERAGVKFADADLIGYPWRVTVGKRTVQDGTVDMRERASGREESIPLADALSYLQRALAAE